jgi:hypothetical protein
MRATAQLPVALGEKHRLRGLLNHGLHLRLKECAGASGRRAANLRWVHRTIVGVAVR